MNGNMFKTHLATAAHQKEKLIFVFSLINHQKKEIFMQSQPTELDS